MNAPRTLARALRAYDPDLRARWSLPLPCAPCGQEHAFWTIEKKVPPRLRQYLREEPKTHLSARSRNIFEGWRAGYLFVLNVHPRLVDNLPLIFDALRAADLHMQGGLDAFNRLLDEQEAQAEAQAERQIDHVVETLNKEAHDQIAWDDGRRVSLYDPDPYAKADKHEDGFLVVDRRVTA